MSIKSIARLADLAHLAFPLTCLMCDEEGLRWCALCRERFLVQEPLIIPSLLEPELDDSLVDLARLSFPTASFAWYRHGFDALIKNYKSKNRVDALPYLGAALAKTIVALCEHLGVNSGTSVQLIPVPTSAESVYRRGHDHVLSMTEYAVTSLQAQGYSQFNVMPVLQQGKKNDQAGFSLRERRENIDNTMWVSYKDELVLNKRAQQGRAFFLIDDIYTTGSTFSEAARALAVPGIQPAGAASFALVP